MENTRDYRRMDLVDMEEKAERLASQPSYRAQHIFHENLISVERYQTSAKLDKPIYTGENFIVQLISSCVRNDFTPYFTLSLKMLKMCNFMFFRCNSA